MVDWGMAGQIGAVGFGLVFVVLIILAISMWLVGRIIRWLEKP
ncbi:MAG: OadG family protein [Dehalococcoidales bacterium]|jgi:Na+-transporting methylmalonyl-CoA/oxaloacetate decarboxylase gamma subunit